MTGARTVKVRIVSTYEDGHESERAVVLPAPTGGDLDTWWEEAVWPETGDGHGSSGLGSCYTATVVAATDPALVGQSREWVG